MGFLDSVNWDSLTKGLNTVGTGAQVISQTIQTLKPSKVAGATTTSAANYSSPQTVGGGSSNALLGLGLLLLGFKFLK
jgi:hypothetical protein